MKITTTCSSLLLLALSGVALAQTTDTGTADTTATTGQPAAAADGMQDGMIQSTTYETRASGLLGEEVENAQGEDIGEIDDLIIAGDSKVLHVVISVGGFLGVNDRLVAIPYEDLQITPEEPGDDDLDIVLNMSRDELKARPEFKYQDGDTALMSRIGKEWDDLKAAARETFKSDDQAAMEESQSDSEKAANQ